MKHVLKQAWAGWKKFAGFLGRIQTRILLTLCYVIVVGPTAAFVRLKSLHEKKASRSNASYMLEYEDVTDEFERARHQF